MPRQFITLEEAADILHIGNSTLRKYVEQGLLRSYRLGSRLIRFDADEVAGLVKAEGGEKHETS